MKRHRHYRKAWLYHKKGWKKGIFVKMYRTRINGRTFTIQRKASPGFIRYWFATHKKKTTKNKAYYNKGKFDYLSYLRANGR